MEVCRFLRSVTFVARSLGDFLGTMLFKSEAPQSNKSRERNGIFYVLNG